MWSRFNISKHMNSEHWRLRISIDFTSQKQKQIDQVVEKPKFSRNMGKLCVVFFCSSIDRMNCGVLFFFSSIECELVNQFWCYFHLNCEASITKVQFLLFFFSRYFSFVFFYANSVTATKFHKLPKSVITFRRKMKVKLTLSLLLFWCVFSLVFCVLCLLRLVIHVEEKKMRCSSKLYFLYSFNCNFFFIIM